MLIDAEPDSGLKMTDFIHDLLMTRQNLRGIEDCTGSMGGGLDFRISCRPRPPFVDEGAYFIPVGVPASRKCLADTCLAVADPNRFLFAYCRGELLEAAMFLGDDEVSWHYSSSS